MNKNQIAIVILIVVGLSSNVYLWNYRYEEGFGIGYTDGTEDGFSTGMTQGREEGFRDGFTTGYNDGEKDGYARGETDGYATGYLKGEEDGLIEGYSDGYSDGTNDGYISGHSLGYELGNATGWEIGYQQGLDTRGWTLRDPTDSEMRSFILRDTTDKLKYEVDLFECVQFSATLKSKAMEAGFQCYYVLIYFASGTGHSIVAFNTTDRGLKYIGPQSDRMFNPVVGQVYWPREYYVVPEYDDTIVRIELIP